MLLNVRAAILAAVRIVDRLLAGPSQAPACEYRRPARVNAHRHGKRERRFHAITPADDAVREIAAQSWWS